MPRLLYVVTHPVTAWRLLEGQLAFMRQKGFEVHLISSPSKELEIVRNREGVSTIAIPMQREIHLLADLVSLFRLYRAIRALQPDIVNAGTPKAGLLGMMASFLARVPVRIYVLRGLRLETKAGFVRFLLTATERMASACATRIISVSRSLRNIYLSMNLAPKNKITVLGGGSSNGIKLGDPSVDDAWLQQKGAALGIPAGVPVIGFVGRLARDKGILELLGSFEHVLSKHPETCLLIVGDYETGDPLPENAVQKIREHPRIVFAGFLEDPTPVYHLMDILVFPSYREGFPNTPLEAAMAAVPVVAFRATGIVDAVLDGETGILVPTGDTMALANAICRYLEDGEMRRAHGKAARNRVELEYQQQVVWSNLLNEYLRLLNASKA